MEGNTADCFEVISGTRLEEILAGISKVKAAVIGDMCLDVYWLADMTRSELSRETPHFPLPIVEERKSPGAGGNVAANIAELRPRSIFALSIIGQDWRADALLKELIEQKIDISHMMRSAERVTPAYCKPVKKGISSLEYEDARIDFDNYTLPNIIEEQLLLKALDEVADDINVLCVCDQMKFGCITDKVREKIMEISKRGVLVVVDSRNRIGSYSNVILKPNEIEGYRVVNGSNDFRNVTFEEYIDAALSLSLKNNSKVCMTLGDKGCLCCDENQNIVHVLCSKVEPPVDICGAGDTFLSSFACSLAAGANMHEAASIANIASSVTIKKVGTTGTASLEEIVEMYKQLPTNKK